MHWPVQPDCAQVLQTQFAIVAGYALGLENLCTACLASGLCSIVAAGQAGQDHASSTVASAGRWAHRVWPLGLILLMHPESCYWPVQHVHSRSSRSGLAQHCSPATTTDDPSLGSAGLAASRLTATNLTEFDALQRQISRKDRPRSGVHGETSCLSRSSCRAEQALTRSKEVQVDRARASPGCQQSRTL